MTGKGMLMKLKAALCALVLGSSISAATAAASEDAVRQAFHNKLKMQVETVREMPFAGMYEVVVDGQIYYTDAKVTHIISGNVLDLRGKEPRNLTQEAQGKLAVAALSKSTDFAVKRVKGNGKRVVYTFEDPNCGYCKELQKELTRMNDVTIYTFLWPILSPDSIDKSKAIWCSKDRAKAWEDYMLRGVQPTGSRTCDTTALERNQRLAQRFNLRGTPAVYIGTGEQVGGYVPADKLEAALSASR